MASTNVEYYEKQKELQDILSKSEQERLKLDQELKAYFQSDKRMAKMKAVRLHNYWKKICEDEHRSKQRNDQIRRDLERIDAHMTSMGSRTEKLRLLKNQYEDYIERTYPNWKQTCKAKMTGTVQQGDSQPEAAGAPAAVPHQESDPITEKVKLQMSQIMNVQAVSKSPMNDPTFLSPATEQPYQIHGQIPAATVPATPAASGTTALSHSAERMVVSTKQTTPRSGKDHMYINTFEARQEHQQGKSQRVPDVGFGDVCLEKPVNQSETPRDISNTQSDTGREKSEDSGPIPVQGIRIEKKTAKQDSGQPPERSSMEPDVNDDLGDRGSDVDLSDAQGQNKVKMRPRSVSGEDYSRDDSISTSKNFTRGSSFHSSKRWSEYGCVKPELTLEGVLFLLKNIQEDFPEAFATDGYYRSYRPDSSTRSHIIHQANSKSSLDTFDLNQVSMVVLEQLLLVVRSLEEGCLVKDALLEEDTSKFTQQSIRQRLSTAAQSLWDGLFKHFSLLIHHKVMDPKEMAAIFVPCIVEDGSLKQDKAYQLLVRLLVAMNADDTDDGSSLASPVHAPTPKTAGGDTFDGKVPPLKFGSLLDRPLTDDESTSIFSSGTREKMPLNETDAYKNMLSGTRSSRPSGPQEEEDTDDDVEKQFASVLSPRTPGSHSALPPAANFDAKSRPPQIEEDDLSEAHSPKGIESPVYVPTAMQPRSTMNSTGSNPPSHRIAGVKISSDLDTDSDIDVLAASKKRHECDEQDDFDFYG